MSTATENTVETATTGEGVESSSFRRYLRRIGWGYFALFCLLFFTILKLPEDRVRNYIQGTMNVELAKRGIFLNPQRAYLSYWLGVSYVMQDVTLTLPPGGETVRVDRISLSPSLLSLIFRKVGGSFSIENGDGTLDGSFSAKTNGSEFSTQLKAKSFNLGKLGVIAAASGLKAGGNVTGTAALSGNPAIPSTMTGAINLNLAKVAIDEQSYMGFSIPRIGVSEGKIDIDIDKAKANIRTFRLGPASGAMGASDDLQAQLTGDAILGRQLESSTLQTTLKFRLAQRVLDAFGGLIVQLMSMAKQADGSYAYQLNGSLAAPNFMPMGSAAAPATPPPAAAPPPGRR